MPKRKAKKSSLSKFYLIAGITVAALVFGKVIITSLMQPAGINELTATNSKMITPYHDALPLATGGDLCYYQDVQCAKDYCEPIRICPVPTKEPISTSVPSPSYVSTPIPKQSIIPSVEGLASFIAKGSCGSNHYLTISFSCRDGRMKEIASNVCTDVYTAFKLAFTSCQSTGLEGASK